MTIAEQLAEAGRRLGASSTTPDLDARVLLGFVLGKPASYLLAHGDEALEPAAAGQFLELVSLRTGGRPVAYLTGVKEFYGRNFFVDERVLVPRPETELLVEAALGLLQQRVPAASAILDIGTGSGAIAITLQLEMADATKVTATDLSSAALAVAKKNASILGAEVAFLPGNLFTALANTPTTARKFDLIVSNPPYLNLSIVDLETAAARGLRHEPPAALAPTDGHDLSIISRILREAPNWLRPAGAVLIEIGHDQGAAALAAALEHFPLADIAIEKDLAGFDRLLIVRT